MTYRQIVNARVSNLLIALVGAAADVRARGDAAARPAARPRKGKCGVSSAGDAVIISFLSDLCEHVWHFLVNLNCVHSEEAEGSEHETFHFLF